MSEFLSPHFSLDELTITQHREVDNSPSPVDKEHLVLLAKALEEVRSILGKPLLITSGFRCLSLNRAIGSKDGSMHTQGLAADFICPQYGNTYEVFQALRKSSLVYDQLILESLGGKDWVHLGLKPQGVKPRMQVLLIDASGTRVA